MIIFTLLSYIVTKYQQSSFPMIVFPSYGVQESGTFTINLINSSSKKLFIGLTEAKTTHKIWNSSYDYKQICVTGSMFISNYNYTSSPPFTWKTNFDSSQTLRPVIISCTNTSMDVNLTIQFKNGSSFLDRRLFYLLYIHPILILLYLLIFIFAIISLTGQFAVFMKFHYYLLTTFGLCIFSVIAELVDIIQQALFGTRKFGFWLKYIFDLYSNAGLFSTFCLAASGWGIHCSTFPTAPFIFTLIFGLTYSCITFLQLYTDNSDILFADYTLKIFSLVICFKDTIDQLRKCEEYLKAYVLIIRSSGFQPATTPVHRRDIMQYVLLLTYLFFVFNRFVLLNLNLFIPNIELWISIAWGRFADLLIIFILVLNYMQFKFDKNDWKKTFFDENEPDSFPLAEFNKDLVPENSGKRIWKKGDLMPPPPLLVEEEHHKNLGEADEDMIKEALL